MIYINSQPNVSGAYANPKGQPFNGCITLNDEQSKVFFDYNGFITITSNDPVTIEPNVEAWEAWKSNLTDEDTAPSDSERIEALENENRVLSAQIEALSDQNEFQEELIVELANVVYA